MNANEPTREQAIAKATEYMAKATSFLMFTYDEEGAHVVQWSGEPDGQTYFDEMGAAIGACCYGTAGYGPDTLDGHRQRAPSATRRRVSGIENHQRRVPRLRAELRTFKIALYALNFIRP
jgi:hypothetical protein